ncbi:TPA: glycosyltransferase, partial [Streptococcus agalactiae]|nr:glycosyltransferase [Streptococcus agalactiae]
MIKKIEKDLISVIVPIYNVEDYLVECIESLIVQTYRNIEILLINDGSTDNCATIAKEFS